MTAPSTISVKLESARNHIEWALELSLCRDHGEESTTVDGQQVRIADLLKRRGYDASDDIRDALARVQIEEEKGR